MKKPQSRRQSEALNTVRKTKKRRFSWRIAALFAMPVIFTILTAFSFYTALEPLVGQYIGFAMLFVSDEPQSVPESNNLLANAPEPNPNPPDWIDIADHTNPESEPDEDELSFIRRSEIDIPGWGDLYARITISGTTVDSPVFWGDTEDILNKGVGTYPNGWLPGFGRTVMMSGHRGTDFYDFRSLEIGAVITIVTYYETYTYEVVRMSVHKPADESAYDFLREEENIILYTCYPFDFIGAARERLFVYAEPLTGTPVARYS
jgi:sortase A